MDQEDDGHTQMDGRHGLERMEYMETQRAFDGWRKQAKCRTAERDDRSKRRCTMHMLR